jgi:hypothetical protein
MTSRLRKEIEEVSHHCHGVREWEYDGDVKKSLNSLLSVVKILASEIERLEQEKISHVS